MTRYEREKDSARRYYESNKEKILEAKRELYRKNHIPVRKSVSRQDQLDRMKQWRIDNKEQFNNTRNKWTVCNIDRVRDIRIKHSLSKQLGCASSDIPIDLLKAKIAVIQVKRKVKELLK